MLFKIADLANVWVIAEVYEAGSGDAAESARRSASVLRHCRANRFSGKIGFIYQP